MARIRTIKPEMARHGLLFDLEKETGLPIRFAWAILPTVCCREGRFKWRPRELKLEVLPHDELDFSRVLDAFLTRGFVVKYRVDNEWYGVIPTFKKHQVINNREQESGLPDISLADEVVSHASGTRACRVDDAACASQRGREEEGKGKGKEGEGVSVRRFAPPSPDEVKAYCLERKNTVDVNRWFSHYESNGWKVGRNPMKDWRAAIRTWEASSVPSGFSVSGKGGKKETPSERLQRTIHTQDEAVVHEY
jgi:hypothetical protein